MKKFILAMVTLFTMTVSTASAMSYEQARQQALFLTDKMAYELNLTDDQYEAAYEVNLDYLMGVNTYDDLYGAYWRQRNADLSYILLDWQYRAFLNATYFYRPLYWNGGYWHFGIYARYPRRDYFFFGRPHFYTVYRGGHSWHRNGGRSWYSGRTYGRPHPDGGPRMGMRDGFNRGDYGRGQSFGNMTRQSSTRTTVTRDRQTGNNRSFGNASRNNNRTFGNPSSTPNRSFGNSSRDNNRSFGTPSSTLTALSEAVQEITTALLEVHRARITAHSEVVQAVQAALSATVPAVLTVLSATQAEADLSAVTVEAHPIMVAALSVDADKTNINKTSRKSK